MTHFDREARASERIDTGMRLAREARDRADYAAAWEYVRSYGLDEISIVDLGLPPDTRPKDFPKRTGLPKFMGCTY